MNFISFRRLKLFKGSGPRQAKNVPAPGAEKTSGRRALARWLQSPFLVLVLLVLVIAYVLSYVPSSALPEIKEGEIAQVDIISPIDLTIEDLETTEKRKAEAEDAVLPVYSFDENVFLNMEERIRQMFEFGREWLKKNAGSRNVAPLGEAISAQLGLDIPATELESLFRAGFSAELQETLVSLVGKIVGQGVIVSKNLFIRREPERGFILVTGPGKERLTRVEEVLDIKESLERFSQETESLELPARNKRLLRSLAGLILMPNITYNRIETDARKTRARERVETVYYRIKKGKVIVRKGDEVTAESLALIRLINQNLRETRDWWRNFAGAFLLFALLFLTGWFYLKSLLPVRQAQTIFLMTGLILLLGLFVYKLSDLLASLISQASSFGPLSSVEVYRYAIPYEFGVLLFAFLTSNTLSLIFCILNSLLVGYLFQANYYLMIFSFLGGLAAIYGIKFYRRARRTSTLRSGLFVVAPVNLLLIVIFTLIRERPAGWGTFAVEAAMALLGGVLSASIGFVLLPIVETVFGFVTETKLLDLTNSDLPVFRQMAIEAPGSYHHSLVVSSLAEKAAEEIGLDTMLVKAGALYHDIGKIKRPEYFIENISRESDVHKDLTPSLSTLVIINHVKEGLDMARKLKLPKKIKEIIEQHHGNSLVRYFYHKAKERYNPEMQKIGEETYRYPGPAPQTKEAALVMLADSVEAASRSLKSPTRENLKRLIIEIFENYLQDGQLDECDFSLRELRAIAASFHSTLYTISHPRLEYPGFDFEMKKKKKPNRHPKVNDRNSQPPA